MTEALLVLADGETFEGVAVGHEPDDGVAAGEVVFNTALAGYQEIVTDPSYAGQIITFTYPHIGNYGVNERDDEARASALPRRDRARPRAPAVELARDRRPRRLPPPPQGRGHRRHRHAPADPPHPRRRRDARRVRHRRSRHAARGRAGRRRHRRPRSRVARSRPPSRTPSGPTTRRFYVVAYDFGIKRSILDQLVAAGLPGRGRARGHARRPTCSTANPTACSSRTVPAIPRPSRRRATSVQRAARQRAGVRHLPRPPDHEPRPRRGDVQAALRSPRRQPPVRHLADRAGSRSRARTTTTRSTPTSLPDGQRGDAPEPERRRRRRRAQPSTSARSACSTTPKRVPVRTTRATCSRSSPN